MVRLMMVTFLLSTIGFFYSDYTVLAMAMFASLIFMVLFQQQYHYMEIMKRLDDED